MMTRKMAPLAHSAPAPGLSGQPYAEHVNAVRCGVRDRASAMLQYAASPPPGYFAAIEAAGAFHDLGKLDPDNQAALAKGRDTPLPWDHIDAGVAYLLASKSGMAAWLVRGHHAPGLPSDPAQRTDNGRRLRGRRDDADTQLRHEQQIARTNATLPDIVTTHLSQVRDIAPHQTRPAHGLEMRLALSCLVDADHADTAMFDTQTPPAKPPKPRWKERLACLDAYVAALKPSGNAERDRHRREFYQACRDSVVTDVLVACEGPVGIGKTTAVTAFLLQRALAMGLRRIVIVAPYTNIISQTVETLRDALCLPGETPSEVVAEHHHRADFSSREARDLAINWSAPVVVTTAVQFFETLATNAPAGLRKLHSLPGSAVFIDEAHAALPAHLWRQNWSWLCTLSKRWGCHFVFVSGSLARFWENSAIVTSPVVLPSLLAGGLRAVVLSAEGRRVRYQRAGRFETVDALVAAVVEQPGPRLVIVNTIQTAAFIARSMRAAQYNVLHLSTALAPKDRVPLLALVKERLKTGLTDWTLVATSCVEAGVDLSFRTAFRERFSAASLIQTGGRVNRHGEKDVGVVHDFLLDATGGITAHPSALYPARVLQRLLKAGVLDAEGHDPAETVTAAMAAEIVERGGIGNDLFLRELERDYPSVAKLGRVIEADTRVVVVDSALAKRIKRAEPVIFRDLLAGSVQLWAQKIEQLQLEPLRGSAEMYRWPYDYDPAFLGIMEGLLNLSDFNRRGFMII